MKKIVVVLMSLTAFAAGAQAEEGRGSVGIGSYVLSTTEVNGASNTYNGAALVGAYDFTNIFSVKAHAYSLTHETLTFLTMKGFDVMARAGQNGPGFTYFGGLGLFNETLTGTILGISASQGFSGGMLGFGLGYNWDKVALEWEGAIRSTQSYKDFTGKDTAAVNASLNISYRF